MNYDKKTLKNVRMIAIAFLVIWIAMLFYIFYKAPEHRDDFNGKTHAVKLKRTTVYLSLAEEILIGVSSVGVIGTFVVLQILARRRNN